MSIGSLSEDEVIRTFRCDAGDVARLRKALERAASEEFANMISSQYSITTIGAAREYRLHLLIKHAYPNGLPKPEVVASLFRLPEAQGRSLLRTVLARYRTELKVATRSALKAALTSARLEDDVYRLTTQDDYLVEAMNAELPAIGSELVPISKFPKTASLFRIEKDTYKALKKL